MNNSEPSRQKKRSQEELDFLIKNRLRLSYAETEEDRDFLIKNRLRLSYAETEEDRERERFYLETMRELGKLYRRGKFLFFIEGLLIVGFIGAGIGFAGVGILWLVEWTIGGK